MDSDGAECKDSITLMMMMMRDVTYIIQDKDFSCDGKLIE